MMGKLPYRRTKRTNIQYQKIGASTFEQKWDVDASIYAQQLKISQFTKSNKRMQYKSVYQTLDVHHYRIFDGIRMFILIKFI